MGPIKQLWNGVDTVKVNFGVAWPETFVQLLEKLDKHKEAAQEAMEPIVFELCPIKPFDQVVALHRGSKNARYGVQVEGLTVFFSCRQIPYRDTPNLYVEAGPEYVAENGLGALYAFVLELIAQLGGEYLWNKVSELHMTVDYQVDRPHTDEDYRKDGAFTFVTRARTKVPRYGYQERDAEEDDGYAPAGMFYKGNRLETLQIGKNQMMLRIYDKKAELARRPRKCWERALWSDPAAQHVMRTEFQVRRESLRLLGYDTVEDVLDRSPELWSYLTRKWFRLYSELNDSQAKVAVLHPFWLAVQEAWQERMPAVKKKVYQELRVQRAQQLLGHATSLAAITPGQRVLDIDDLMKLMTDLLRELLPTSPDVVGDIRDKAVRFQCRNKSDIDLAEYDSSAMPTDPSRPDMTISRGDVIPTPQGGPPPAPRPGQLRGGRPA